MPSCTSGVVSCRPSPMVQAHARRRLPTLEALIWSSGLYPQWLYVRRHIGQSSGGGSTSIASVTGSYVTSSVCPETDAPQRRETTKRLSTEKNTVRISIIYSATGLRRTAAVVLLAG